jgi:hypothetical protein
MGAVGAKLSAKSIEYTTQVANGSDHDIYVLVDGYRPRVERATAQVRDVAFNSKHCNRLLHVKYPIE